MRPFKTRFRCASTYRLKLARKTKSLTHYTKGTPSGCKIPPTACRRPVSGTVSLPSSGCFSPFPHGTGSLSVSKEYLAFGGGPPIFRQDFTCPALLDMSHGASRTGLSPAMADLSRSFRSHFRDRLVRVRSPLLTESLIDVLSSGYLDVSVPRVCS